MTRAVRVLQRDERPVLDKTGLSGNYDFTVAFPSDLIPPLVLRCSSGLSEGRSLRDKGRIDCCLRPVPDSLNTPYPGVQSGDW